MGNFNRDNRSSNRDGGSRFGGGRDSGRSQMHKAVCDECGKNCEVPFRPTGEKPIYCSECFGSKRDSGGRDSGRRDYGGGRDSGRRDYGGGRDSGGGRDRERTMYIAVCDKCKEKCEVPFRPSKDKPIFCQDCFNKEDRGGRSSNSSGRQMAELNEKLDKIIELLSPKKAKKVEKEAAPKEKVTEEKVEEKKVTETKKAAPKKAAAKKKAAPKKTAAKKKAAPKKKIAAKKTK